MQRASVKEAEIQAVLSVLAKTPKEIARIARGRSDSQLQHQPETDAWSAQEIVAHLRACAEVWGASIDGMLAEDHPTIRYVSPRGWIRKTEYLQQSFRDTLRALSQQRDALFAMLSKLEPNEPRNFKFENGDLVIYQTDSFLRRFKRVASFGT